MQSNNNPSIDPADNESLAGMLQFVFKKMMQNVDGMLPAQVIKYDRAKNRVQVQLLITMITTDGSQIPRSQIAEIPVVQLGGGGYLMNFNLNPGDFGFVLASDRDISLFLQSYAQSPPNTYRLKSFSDGIFIPTVLTGYTIDEEDPNNAVIQNLDGTVKISLTPLGVKITGALIANGGITITGGTGGSINVTGNMNLTGDIAVTGNITATGDITPHV